MGLLNDIFASGRNVMPMGSKEANRTEPFTAGGILQRDPNLSFGAGLKDFKQSFQPEAGFAPMGSAEYNENLKAARAKRIEDTKPTSSVDTKVKTETENKPDVLLPDAKLKGKSFMGKLQSGIDKIFTMQENDPKGYAAMMSGIDLYSRSQTQDLATALLGNNKYNTDQANALMQANMNAMSFKMTVAKYDKAVSDSKKPETVTPGELEIAKNIIKKDVNKNDIEAVGNFIAGRAKQIMLESGNTLGYEQAITIAYGLASKEGGGLKNAASIYGKEYVIDPEGITNATTKQHEDANSLAKKSGKDNYTLNGKLYKVQ
jgi:hypothetical protein